MTQFPIFVEFTTEGNQSVLVSVDAVSAVEQRTGGGSLIFTGGCQRPLEVTADALEVMKRVGGVVAS